MSRSATAALVLVFLAPLQMPAPSAAQEAGSDWTGAPPVAHLPLPVAGPTRIAVDSEGRFYVTHPERRRLVVADAHGRNAISIEVNAKPLSIAVGSGGRIYLGDAERRAVHVFSAQGFHLFDLGDGPDEFLQPNDIALDEARGRIYVADSPDHRIQVYDLMGFPLQEITSTPSGPLSFPAAVAVQQGTGALVVSDHNGQVEMFDDQGAWIRSIGSMVSPAGLCTDDDGVLYVAEAFQAQVVVFEGGGLALGTVGDFGTLPGQLKTPTDVVLDPWGRLAVVSYNNGTVEIYGPSGHTVPPEVVLPPSLERLVFPSDTVHATVEFLPRVLNPASRGNWFKARIELADGSAGSIDLSTVLLEDRIQADHAAEATVDDDQDGVAELEVFFDRAAVIDVILSSAGTEDGKKVYYELTVTGSNSRVFFEATDSVGVPRPK